MHFQDLLSAGNVRVRHDDLAIEAARAQQRGVEHVRPVGRGDQDDAFIGLEPVHLDEQLVQGLLTLVIAAAQPRAAMPADGVDLVDKDDAGRVLLALFEHVAHAAGADADKHLDEVRTADAEERSVGLAGDRLCQKRLARAGRTDHQYAFRDSAAQPLKFLRIFEEFHQFRHLLDGFVDARHVLESGLVSFLG